MRNESRTNLAASVAALLLLAAPVAASNVVETTSPATALAAAASRHGALAAEPQTADSAMPAMLQLAVTRSEAADVASDYHVGGDGHGTNPQHGFDLAFTPRGARVDGPAGGFALHLERFGRGDGRPVHRAAPRIDGAWVEYDRGSGLSEWFVNLPDGVEQGWTVARRPAGDGMLALELDTARPPEESDDGRLAWSGLVYHRLVALDADGRELPATWTHDGDRLRIEVDDRDAAYPVLIDPWVQQAKLIAAGGAAGDQFGFSVAVDGDTALVGAFRADVDGNTNQGVVYVFTRSDGVWGGLPTQLVASDGSAGAEFGRSVALEGDTAVVGARNAQVDGEARGAAYIFTRSAGVWSEQAKLTADDGAAGDALGRSVALEGDTAVVGATGVDLGDLSIQGAAYVFTGSGAAWTQQAKLTASDGAESDRPQFGISVALSGDTAVVGAFGAEVEGRFNQGAAYVFTRSGAVWSEQAKLTASDGVRTDEFGSAVAVEGDTALIGAFGDNNNIGSMYVFTRSGAVWSQRVRLGPSGAAGRFGISIALEGNTAVVGTIWADIGGNRNSGAAVVFTGSGAEWNQQAILSASDGAPADQLGRSVALSGDTALVGAALADSGDQLNRGAAYVFTSSGGEWSQQAKLTDPAGKAGDQFGRSIAIEGDTALVGAPQADVNDRVNQGAAWVFTRSGGVWTEEAKLIAADGRLSLQPQFGISVALDGDTALVGAHASEVDAVNEGATYVFTRSGGVWSQQAKLIAPDGGTGAQFGAAVDLDGDSALVGAFGRASGRGRAYVFTRSGEVWSLQSTLLNDDSGRDRFGIAVALDGDTAVVGAYLDDVDGNVNQGSALVFTRSGEVWSQQAKLTAADGAASDQFGRAVALAGDTALAGAAFADIGGNADQGAVYVFTRSGSSWSEQAKLTAADGAAGDVLSFVGVALEGDTALTGAPGNDGHGSAYLFTRSGEVWSEQAKLAPDDGAALDRFGVFVALAGDTALVGASGAAVNGATGQGAAYVFLDEPEPGPGGTVLRFAPASLNYGDVEVGTASAPLATTLTNTGTSEVTGLGFSTPGNGFAVDGSACGASLPAGASCEVSVVFTPAANGLSVATLRADGDGGLTSNEVVLAGNGVDPDGQPAETLSFSPASLNFDNVDVGTESPALVTTLTNIGSTEATGLTFDLPANGFSADTSACGAALPAGASCDVSVTFTPADLGLVLDALQASAVDAISNPVVLSGNGVDADDPGLVLEFDPNSLDFGDVALGTVGPTLTTTLTNTGDVDATGLAFNVPGSGFTTDTSDCGTTLAAGASCVVEITFVPPVLGPVSAALEAGSDEGFSSSFVLLTGRGTDGGGGGEAPELVFEPEDLDFGEVVVGAESAPLAATLTNIGNADATDLGFTVSDGAFAADTGDCGTALPAGASCEVSLTFAPTVAAPVSATLVAAAAAQGAVSNPVDLSGTGLPSDPGAPVLTMTPADLDFGNVAAGSTSPPLSATLSNTGDVEATGLAFAVSHPDFSADTSACGASLPAGASCEVSVTFTPATVGLASATVHASSAEGATVHLGLNGNGVDPDPGAPVLELAPVSLDFGSVPLGSSSSPQVATLTNSGDVDAQGLELTVSSEDFDVDPGTCGDVLAAGASCEAQLVFTPSARGSASGTLLAVAVDGGEGVISNPVGLSGVGVDSGPGGTVLQFVPASLNYGDVEVGTDSTPRVTTLTNTGTTEITGLVFSTPGNGFAVDSSACGTSLPAGASCEVSVVFTPAASGVAVATLRADGDGGLTSNEVVLAGNGVEPDEEPEETLVFSPSTLNFDNVDVGTESPALVTTLTNIGDTEATGLTFDLPANGFTADTSACGASLPAGASCDVSATFTPAAAGLVLDDLQASAVGAISNAVLLAGNGVEPDDPDQVLVFDPTSLDFGEVELGATGPTLTTTLTNTGDVDATGLAFNVPGSGFSANTGDCGTTLAAGASCTVDITFVPPLLGPVSAALEAGSAEGLSSNHVLLTGRGVDEDGGGGGDEPVLVFDPANVDFGSVVVGEESAPFSVTLSNTGDVDATNLGFAVSDGVFAADTADCGDLLSAGASCEVTVIFAPATAAPVSATLLAVAGAQGVVSNPVELSGVGLPAGSGVPVLTVDPSQLDFGNVAVGSTSPALTATLSNVGDVEATGLAFVASHPDFSADTGACGASLPAGASCQVSVTFTPGVIGVVSATLEATSGEGATVHLGLNGNGIDSSPGVPVLELAPAGLDFGIVPVGSSSPPLTATLTNSGDVEATGLDFAISHGAFNADTSACGDLLAAGASCDVSVVFTPSAIGPASATLLALADGGDEGVTSNPVGLSGEGADSGPGGGTVLHFVPASLNFGDVEVGTTSAALITTLTNTGTTEVSGLAFTAPGDGFTVDSSACGTSLPAGGSCDVSVDFTPAATGLVAATLQADGSGGETSNLVVLAGNGVEPGEGPEETLVFSPASLNFDHVEVGTESSPQVTTLTNIGDTEATGLTFDLPADGFTADTSACGASLPAGASCDVSVTFTPAEVGLAIDAIQASAVGAISNSVVLAGNGVDPGDPNLVLIFDPTNLDFGDVELGTSGPTLTTTLTNTGDVDATGLAFNTPGSGFSVDSGACGTTLAAGASCEVSVSFVPPVLGPVTAALEAGSDEGLTSNFVLLSGRGTDDGGGGGDEPVLVFDPTSLDFGSVVVGEESAPQSVTLSNTGGADATELGFAISDGAFAADTSVCGTSLPAGASCDVSVTFTPTVAAPVGATMLAVAAAEGAVSNPVDLNGVGLPAGPGVPVLTMTPSQLDFGNVEIASTSLPLTATLANSGDVEATGLTFEVSDLAFSADTSACGASLPAGASCEVSVTFTPVDAGLVGANLQASAAEGATVNLGLSGNGIDAGPGVPILELAPAGLDFGIVPVDSSSPPLVTTLTNSGDVDAEGLTFAISGADFSADTSACGTVLAAGASCDVSIVFTPSALGPVSATLVALAGDGVEGVTSNPVDLNGIGGPSGPQDTILAFLPASLNYGDVEVGTESDPLITTLINGGDTEVTGLTFSTPGNGFTVDSSTCGTSLPAGGSCDVSVVFTPAATGLSTATLRAEGDGGLTSNVVVLAGNGAEPGEQPEETLVFDPASINFDNVEVGTESSALVTTLTNIGDTEASGLTFDLPAAEFAVDTSACGASLPSGASCDVSVTFTPAILGLEIDSLQASAVGAISNPVVLAGNGVDADDPDLVLVFDPTELDFGDVELGTSGPTLTTTLTNTGDVDATGLAFNVPGSGFSVDSGACGTTLAAGASCAVEITFVPPVLGPVTAALEAASAEGLSSNFVLLIGRGTDDGGGGGDEPELVFDPASLDFGSVAIGEESAPQSLTLSNIGDADATELGFALSDGAFAADTSACGTSLAAGASCDVSVTFTPTIAAPVSATLQAVAAAQGAVSNSVDLTGVGLPAGPGVPVLTMTPAELDFGNVEVGSISPSLTATLANSGDVEATGLTFEVSDLAYGADTSACGASLPAGASCAISVTFTPPAPGLVGANLQASSAEGAAVNLGLGGNGIDSGPGVPVLELAPASLDFGIVPVDASSPPLVTTLTNSGDVDAEGLDFAISNGVFSADTSACGAVLAAGASCDVSIVFTPSALGPVSATLVALAGDGVEGVTSNAAGLSGIGGPSGPQDTILHFIPASLNYGDVEVGTESDSLTTTLINGGTTEVTGLTFSTPGNGFSVDASACGTSLPAGGTCDVLVAFSPAAPGLFAATLQADSGEGLTSNPVVLAGNGVDSDGTPAETLVFSPATLNFDNVVVGTESPALVTTLTNIGDTDASGLTFDLPAAEFTVDTGACGASLPAGASCDVSVTFTPAALGLAVDALQASAVGAISNPVVLAGNGVEADDPDLVLVFDPTELDFGDVELGSTGPTLTTTLTNTGDVDATGLAFNTPGSGFTVDTGDCGTGLPAGASCEVAVTFVPQLLGPVTAALQAGSAEGLTSNFVLFAGRGVEEGGGGGEPVLVFDPTSLDFGPVEVGSSSVPQSAQLSNVGDGDATELTFTVSNEDFEVDADACGDSLPASATCEVSVVFTPSEVGPVEAELTAASVEGASADLTLSGVGGVEGLLPLALAVDTEELLSDGNSVFEPGERVEVAPEWFNNGSAPIFLGGNASDFTGPQGPDYTLVDDGADFGEIAPVQSVNCRETGDCYEMEVGPSGVPRPGQHWDAAFDETLSDPDATEQPWVLHIGDSFLDTPRTHIFYRFIENLFHNGITLGCTDTDYCPGDANTRGQMSVFVLRSLEGADYQSPPCEAGEERLFADVPEDHLFCSWIEDLANRGVVQGCGDGNFCPGDPVTRAQMSIFLLKTLEGVEYEAPECSGLFADVGCPSLFGNWIEDLFLRGITEGCEEEPLIYCPSEPNTRGQMAVFLTRTFGLQLYGP